MGGGFGIIAQETEVFNGKTQLPPYGVSISAGSIRALPGFTTAADGAIL
jgi:hypothetical protein